MALPNLISLNGVEFTDQGRTLSSSRDERSATVQLANGLTKKYFMAVKYSFSLNWTMLPSTASKTYDKKGARDELKALVDTQDTLTLIVRSPIGSSSTYTVWVDSYSEDIVRRDYISNTIFYEVKLDLKEQ
jgi:hypothetical protein